MKSASCALLAAGLGLLSCAEAPSFDLGAASSLTRVFFDRPAQFETVDTVRLSAAGGEYESFQLVIFGHPDTLRAVQCSTAGLSSGSAFLPPEEVAFNPVGYVLTTVASRQYGSALGWWPDPLLEMDTFEVAPGEVQPVWVTIHVPAGAPAGDYRGTVSVSAERGGSRELAVRLRVRGFDLPLRPSIKTLTWVSDLAQFYGFPKGGAEAAGLRRGMYDLLLRHRLGPGGNLELTDQEISYCMERGMNAFLLDVIPNLKRQGETDFSKEYKERLVEKLKSCVEKFGPRGWLDGVAYVYNYDEVDEEHWPLARQMYSLVKGVSPELKVIQCLNIPEGVKALAGYADTWDVYVAQYEKTGVRERVAAGDEAWLAVCCYPVDHPNFFLEYPPLDGRLIGWICWQTGVTGFEYWSPNHWGDNRSGPGLRGNWIANTFRNYNGDGYLTYPGPDGKILSSVRLENLRDGFEDYEYLKLLASLKGDLTPAGRVAASTTEFTADPDTLYRARDQIAEEIEKLIGREEAR